MAITISIVNCKGGVGKSSTTNNLAHALTKLGKRVLMIDLDPQASLSTIYGLDALGDYNSIFNVLTGEVEASEIICEIEENLYLLPSTIQLTKAELFLINKISRETILKKKLEPLQDLFDFIIIDNSPSLGLLVVGSLVASQYAISPCDSNFLGYKGLEILMEVIEEVIEVNPELKFLGILVTLFDSRVGHHKQVINLFKDKYHVFRSVIKRSIKFADASLNMKSIFEFAGDNFEGSIAYMDVAKEVLSYVEENNS